MILKRFKPYFSHLKEVRWQFVIGLIAGITAAVASGAGLPFIIKVLVPLVTGDHPPEGIHLILTLAIIPLAFSLRSIGTYANAYFMAAAGMHVLENIRIQTFCKLQQLPLGFFHENKAGDLMSRVMNDALQLQTAVVQVVNDLIKQPATLIAATTFLIVLAVQQEQVLVLLIALISVPVCLLPIRIIGKRILTKAHQAQKETGNINSVLNENLAAIREVRTYRLEASENRKFAARCRDFLRFTLKKVKYNQALSPLIEFVTSITIAFTFYVVIAKEIQAEDVAAILTALYMSYQPVKRLGAVSNTLREAEASLDRLEHILHSEDTVPEPVDPKLVGTFKGNIRFENVGFQYTDTPALHSVTTNILPGESVALVGPSGAGKSTFANLVPRFYDVTSGRITIEGIDIRDVAKADLRSQIALVSQETVLFEDTIAKNIEIGKPDATLDEIKAAARQAHAHEFIEKLKDGYETLVGERGSRLSGGQCQRISIARAFLKNAPIVILDEPTSSLDAESEHCIQAALEILSRGRTVLIIAHRFSTIQHADRILVLEKGKIIASGTHEELHSGNKLYRNLYDKQSKTALTH